MTGFLARRSLRLVLASAALLTVCGGIAYATIPDGDKVFTACMLKVTGTIRLIDPSLGGSSLLGRCTTYETRVSWNGGGGAGVPGPQGPQGPLREVAVPVETDVPEAA